MHRSTVLALLALFVLPVVLCAQQTLSWADFVQEMHDDEWAQEQGWEEYLEELEELHRHPIDVNQATLQQLLQLPFIDEEQADDIIAYVLRNDGMRSIHELKGVGSIDLITRRYLSLFLYAGPMPTVFRDTLTLRRLLQRAQHDLRTRLDVPLYYRKGYSTPFEKGGYDGLPLYNRISYRLTSRHHFQLGLQAEKDAGESFRRRGWDNYGAFLSVANLGPLATAIVGQYRLNFGLGLVLNNNMTMGKQQLPRMANSLRPRTGTDENRYFSGAALQFRLSPRLTVATFFSHRQLDATQDTSGCVTTLLTTGLHRTQSELSKRGQLGATFVGGNVQWNTRSRLQLGATGYWQHTNRPLDMATALYRRFYPVGTDFGVAGLYYGYSCRWLRLHGETAYSTNHRGVATLHHLTFPLHPDYTLSLVQRYYAPEYYSFYASAMGDNTQVQDENGVLLRLDAAPLSSLQLTAYADLFSNPWPRYGLRRSSQGQEILLQPSYIIRRDASLQARYQWKNKAVANGMQSIHRLRLTYKQGVGERWTLQTVAQLNATQRRAGYGMAQTAAYEPSRLPLRLRAMLAAFRASTYQHRLYFYEPTIASAFGYQPLHGRGLRYALSARLSLCHQRLTLEAKYGGTTYFDRTLQSSGQQTIYSRYRNDLQFQLHYRFRRERPHKTETLQ